MYVIILLDYKPRTFNSNNTFGGKPEYQPRPAGSHYDNKPGGGPPQPFNKFQNKPRQPYGGPNRYEQPGGYGQQAGMAPQHMQKFNNYKGGYNQGAGGEEIAIDDFANMYIGQQPAPGGSYNNGGIRHYNNREAGGAEHMRRPQQPNKFGGDEAAGVAYQHQIMPQNYIVQDQTGE